MYKLLLFFCVAAQMLTGQVMFTVDGDLIRPPFNIDKYATLVRLLDVFDRKMAGCPTPKYQPGEVCSVGAGIVDLKLLREIQKLAPEALALPVAKGKSPGSAKGSKRRE